MSRESAQALGRFGQAGELPPGDWFVSGRAGGRFETCARDGNWDGEITDGGIWKPVGGPQVGAQMRSTRPVPLDGFFVSTEFWLEFDQEAHPFGRFDLHVSSLAYEEPSSGLRLFVPQPESRDRVSVWMRVSPGTHACEAYVPGVVRR